MDPEDIKFKYRWTYDFAGLVHQLVYENPPEEYLQDYFSPQDNKFLDKISKPQKHTILHDLIEIRWILDYEYLSRKLDYEDLINHFEEILKVYNVKVNKRDPDDRKYCDSLEKLMPKANPPIVGEIFNILYGDRMFLLKLNEIASKTVRCMKMNEFPKILEKDGVLKRRNCLPIWLKYAVRHRDKDRCQGCGKDLSVMRKPHHELCYDHIVPLNKGGTNDPTNFQLLCNDCNLKKGGVVIKTSEYYTPYW
ncbi:MAG: HNH endonuclease [Candidatus Aenigmarchaeota archaeon]|nr:HNH endonuclease [Candidatus Aenigmarchaeota archaeon]